MAADAASRKKSIEELLFNGGRNDDDETSGVDSTSNVSDSDLRNLSAKKSPRRGRDGSADSRDRELKRKSSAKYARRRSLSQNARGRSLPPTSAETVRASRDALARDIALIDADLLVHCILVAGQRHHLAQSLGGAHEWRVVDLVCSDQLSRGLRAWQTRSRHATGERTCDCDLPVHG